MTTTALTTDVVAWAVFAVAISVITKVAHDLFTHWRSLELPAHGCLIASVITISTQPQT